LARSSKPELISARALLLTPRAAHGTTVQIQVTLLIVLADGGTKARPSRIAIRSGSSAYTSMRAQQVW
jgi:hypothetical protein